jgi:hypothetical protein
MNNKNENQYVFQRKPRFCRHCQSKSIATYLYGMPNEKAILMIKTGAYAAAGCCLALEEYQRAWCCNDCGGDFYKKANLP